MRKQIALFISMILVFCLTACGNNKTNDSQNSTDNISEGDSGPAVESAGNSDVPETGTETDSAISEAGSGESRILIAYFSVPEDVDTSGVDAIAGASIVVKDGEVMGNTEYVAKVIQQTVGGDLFRIETTEQYPLDHDPLVDQAAEEQDANARPALSTHIDNLEKYDTIILGYPNWWGDMPMPVYSFLEEYDFGAKQIIPFITHGGSGASRTVDTISELQPGALMPITARHFIYGRKVTFRQLPNIHEMMEIMLMTRISVPML